MGIGAAEEGAGVPGRPGLTCKVYGNMCDPLRNAIQGHLGGSVVERLPLAQVVILGSWDRVLHWGLLWEPASPCLLSLPLCVCVSHE